MNSRFESAADSGISKMATCLSESLGSTSGPSVCSHLYATISPSSSLLSPASR
ncbi:MAG TPA: hypothetical protein VFH19_02110 [Nitrososphaeraceae archaeon]|nr:hypothetical protein [Nitrososphaeraceae archaeon]